MKIQLPAGNTNYSEPMVRTKTMGDMITGAGKNDHPWAFRMQGTRVYNKDMNNKYIFELTSRCFKVSDFSMFNGGIWVKPTRGFGTGHGRFDNLSIRNGTIKFGDPSYNGNAADCSIRDTIFSYCDPAIEITTSQNINFLFENCEFNRCPVILNVLGGGMVTFRDCYVIGGGTVIKVDGTCTGAKTGSGNGHFVIDGMRWDQQLINPTVLLDDDSPHGGGRTLTIKDSKLNNAHFKTDQNIDDFIQANPSQWDIYAERVFGINPKVFSTFEK